MILSNDFNIDVSLFTSPSLHCVRLIIETIRVEGSTNLKKTFMADIVGMVKWLIW